MDERFPFPYQIACLVLTSLFVLAFSVSREPRGWRRFFQCHLSKSTEISVNRNKFLDEKLKQCAMILAMMFLVADVMCFVAGVTYPLRQRLDEMTPEEKNRVEEMKRLQSTRPGSPNRSTLP